MLLPLVAVTLIRASLPFITLLVVIPSTSPTTYPEPPVLDVTEAEEISPAEFVAIVAVIPLPLPVILYKGTAL